MTVSRGELSELEALEAEFKKRKQRGNPLGIYCPHTPHPKQAEFLKLDCLEALFGGAAGGGKSDALLMGALQHVHVPGYAALILRRTYADLALPNAIMARSHEWLSGTGAVWNEQKKEWRFPESGATLTFGYMDNERDKYRYQGAAVQYIGFDELTQFPESWYLYLLSRTRRDVGMKVPIRVRSASNPGGIGHDWVKRRFVDGQGGAVFVPSTLKDNPSIDAKEYEKSLALLDPITRQQLRDGIWVRDGSGLVYMFSDERSGIDAVPSLTRHILAIDFGFTDSTAFVVLGWRDNDPHVYVVESWKQEGLTPSAVAEVVRSLENRYGFDRIVGDTGGLGKAYAEEARQRFAIPIEAADKHNKRGYISLLNGDLAEGRLKLRIQDHPELVQELRELPWNKDRSLPENGFEDHLCDALLYGWRACKAFLEQAAAEKPAPGSKEFYQAQADEYEQAAMRKLGNASMPWWKRVMRR